jgi:4-diphosphocytidyl-2-C-methyl-D-erythritol kinase
MIVRGTAEGLEVRAPAKLNLFLEVPSRRTDGYHEVVTLMVAVDLFDTLAIADDPSGRVTLTCDDPTLPTGAENLVVKAAERLRAAAGSTRGARISLAKAIPSQAGLAGGSSDAAATLAGLDRLWGLGLPPRALDAVAAEVGSDVAFFLHTPAALCTGRGERVEPVELTHSFSFVLICPEFGVSTADVYRNLTVPDRPRGAGPTLEALRSGDPAALGRSLFNRLQPAAESLAPGLIQVREALTSLGPSLDGHLMSGSGSAFFGLARDHASAAAAAQQLETLGLGRVRVVTCGP